MSLVVQFCWNTVYIRIKKHIYVSHEKLSLKYGQVWSNILQNVKIITNALFVNYFLGFNIRFQLVTKKSQIKPTVFHCILQQDSKCTYSFNKWKHKVMWWNNSGDVELAIYRSKVQSPAILLSCSDPRLVVHTSASVHQAVQSGTGQKTVIL